MTVTIEQGARQAAIDKYHRRGQVEVAGDERVVATDMQEGKGFWVRAWVRVAEADAEFVRKELELTGERAEGVEARKR